MKAVSDQQAEAHRRHVEDPFRHDKAHWEEEIRGGKERQYHEGEALFINMEKLSIIHMLNYSEMVQDEGLDTVMIKRSIENNFMIKHFVQITILNHKSISRSVLAPKRNTYQYKHIRLASILTADRKPSKPANYHIS